MTSPWPRTLASAAQTIRRMLSSSVHASKLNWSAIRFFPMLENMKNSIISYHYIFTNSNNKSFSTSQRDTITMKQVPLPHIPLQHLSSLENMAKSALFRRLLRPLGNILPNNGTQIFSVGNLVQGNESRL